MKAYSNSCSCIDHRANGLGTCKHIEGVLAALRQRNARAFRGAAAGGTPRIEVFLDRRGAATPALMWSAHRRRASAASRWLAAFVEPDGRLACGPSDIEALISAWRVAPADIRRRIRVSRHFAPWLDRLRRERSREEARMAFLAEVKDGAASFDLLHHPLLPYQREGMLHLVFGERALLADEMGLGKTIQAIAACELLARRKGIERVLVVCPASLKAEWEEQIARFTERSARSVFGARPARLSAYREPPFFTIVNYEQVLGDAADINEILQPDIVVLDEAQRIKNWQTKTARRVKSLRSPYAFVLTGTPVENRIDELYSIVQYLDPELVGPLFRFNRDFYELDERGRPVDYQNLGELRAPPAAGDAPPPQVRRRSRAPGPHGEDLFRADGRGAGSGATTDYRSQAARLLAIAQRRPLTPKEFERLQMLLACMRMICDTPAILDPTCRVSPKLEELEGILNDLLEEPERKIIIFSEWERMLELVRELAAELGIEAAWHTGSVPQQRRRAEIVRFKQDPACRLFLSTDSGSVGLNLQVGERGRQHRPAVEPGETRTAHRARLAQEPDPLGHGRQSRQRGFDRAPHPAPARSQAGAGRRRARRPRRSRRAQDAIRTGSHDRAHAGDDAGTGDRAPYPVAGRSRGRGAAASPWRTGAADRGPHRRRWPRPPVGSPRPRRRSARGRGEAARGAS